MVCRLTRSHQRAPPASAAPPNPDNWAGRCDSLRRADPGSTACPAVAPENRRPDNKLSQCWWPDRVNLRSEATGAQFHARRREPTHGAGSRSPDKTCLACRPSASDPTRFAPRRADISATRVGRRPRRIIHARRRDVTAPGPQPRLGRNNRRAALRAHRGHTRYRLDVLKAPSGCEPGMGHRVCLHHFMRGGQQATQAAYRPHPPSFAKVWGGGMPRPL